MPLELKHIPFMEKMRLKELDGVYRYKSSGSIAVFKNAYRRGYVRENEALECSVAYDAITVSINSEQFGRHKRCIVNMDEWEKILNL